MKEKIILKAEYMREALLEARAAALLGEVPVGAVVVRGGEIIARAHNRVEANADASAHAELLALRAAAQKLGSKYLSGCELYVTLEPCPMCMGAILNFRVGALAFGAFDPASGCCASRVELNRCTVNPPVPFVGGMLEGDCAKVLSDFFLKKREAEKPLSGGNL